MAKFKLDPIAYKNSLDNLLKLPAAGNPIEIQKQIARDQVSTLQNRFNIAEDEAKGILYESAGAYFENKGLSGAQLNEMLQQQLSIINYTQAKHESWRLKLAELAPAIAPISTTGGFLALASRAAPFAAALASGGGLAAGFAAMGPVGYIGGGLLALGYVLPQALNVSNDYTAMQPTMMAGVLSSLKKEAEKMPDFGITEYGSFVEADIDNFLRIFQNAGIAGYGDPIRQMTALLTKDNIRASVKGIIDQLNAQGTAPTKKDVLAILAGWMLDTTQANKNRELAIGAVAPAAAGITAEEVTRITKSKTAKPKIFIGTVLSGRVGKAKELVRQLDDKITDDQDLKNDVIINMTNWLASLPGKLNFEVQIKYNPFDELGTKKLGMWCTLAFYITNNYGKRMFVDEILLGPIDPLVYYPETSRMESIAKDIPAVVSAVEIKPTELPSGQILTLTETGETVQVVPPGTTPAISALEAEVKKLEAEKAKLTAAVAAAQAAPVATTPPVAAKPADKFNYGDSVIVSTGGSCLHTRLEPGLGGTILACLPDGTQLKIKKTSVPKDGYNWVRVEIPSTGAWVYVAEEFLKKV